MRRTKISDKGKGDTGKEKADGARLRTKQEVIRGGEKFVQAGGER